MGNRLEGKVALITGAAAGIGLATAERFVQEGASVVLGDSQVDLLDRESARVAAAGFRVRAVAMDVTRSDDVRLAVAVCCSEFGRMDILFANAGIGGTKGHPHDLALTQLAHKDHVAILPQGLMQPFLERRRVLPDLDLRDQGLLVGMHELDRILDRDDLAAVVAC